MLPSPAPPSGVPSAQQFYIVRVDAPPGVATIAADGCFVTVESGPHPSLQLALHALQHPKQHAYVLPDIIFLPTLATVYALNEPVPSSKPRLVVSAETVQQARLPAPRQPLSGSRGSARKVKAEDASSAGSPMGTPAAAAAKAAAASKALQLATSPTAAPAAAKAAWQLPSLSLMQEFATSPPTRPPKQQVQPPSPLSSSAMAPPALPVSPLGAAAAASLFAAAAGSPASGARATASALLPPLQLARTAQQVQALLQQQLAVGQQQQQQRGRPLLLASRPPGAFSMAIQTPSPKRQRADEGSPTGQQAEQQQQQAGQQQHAEQQQQAEQQQEAEQQQQQQQQQQQRLQATPAPQPQQGRHASRAAELMRQQARQEEEPLHGEPSLSLLPVELQGPASSQAPKYATSQLLPALDHQQYQLAAEQLLQKLIQDGARPHQGQDTRGAGYLAPRQGTQPQQAFK